MKIATGRTPEWLAEAVTSGNLDTGWARLLAELPRTRFLPDVVWARSLEGGEDLRVDRTEAPEGWAAWAGRDVPLVTQWADQMAPDLPGQVIGIEYDPQVAAAARDRIHAAGLSPLVVTGDGTASGPFLRPVRFMGSRTDHTPHVDRDDYLPPGDDWPPGTIESTTTVRPEDLWDDPYGAAWWTIGLLVPGMTYATSTRQDGTVLGWLFSLTCRSWAIAFFDQDPQAEVYQGGGPRRLWEEVETAHRWWAGQGRPGHEEFGLTTGPDGERVWLRSPGTPLPATRPGLPPDRAA